MSGCFSWALSVDEDGSGVAVVVPDDAVKHCCFSCSGETDDAVYVVLADADRDVFENLVVVEGFAESLYLYGRIRVKPLTRALDVWK